MRISARNREKVRVNQEGTHGVDDLKIKVYAPDMTFLQDIDIDKEDPLNQVYTLSNGVTITLGAGDIVKDEEFTVDLSLLNTSFNPSQPAWTGSTANATIGGVYLGSNGTGALTFRVDREGTHGVDDLKIKVYAPDTTFIQDINIDKNDPLNKIYTLVNGLTLELSAGDLVQNETFTVNVDAADPLATGPTQPQWILSSAAATINGLYDGSNGTGSLTFRVDQEGTHGVDNLTIKVYAPDMTFLQDIDIDKEDPLNQVYTLDNGLTLELGAGNLIKNETFAVALQTSTTFSTTPHPVESTAEVTIGGVYDGTQGTGELSFQIVSGGTHGVDALTIDVYDPNDTLIETINVSFKDPLNKVYQLSNGLTFQLSSGTLVANETFTVDVNDQIGSSVNPDKPFDGTRNDNSNFDIGLGVTSGSFDVNGITINVFANDTINTVLDRITSSAADVTATFDAGTETVYLSHNSPGPAQSIVLENDTSGFLAATKLTNAVSMTHFADTTTPIAQIDSLSSISSGSFQINGISISIDIDSDSIDDVVNAINSSAADVTAQFDTQTNKLSIVANQIEDLVLDSGTTNFFEAMGISVGTYASTPETPGSTQPAGYSRQNRKQVAKTLEVVSRALNSLLEDPADDLALESMRLEVRKVLGEGLSSKEMQAMNRFRLRQEFDTKAFQFDNNTKQAVMSRLQNHSGVLEFRELMFGTQENSDGLLERLTDVIKQAEKDMRFQAGNKGVFVDLYL